MYHGVIVNDPFTSTSYLLRDYMHQEPEEMPRLFLFSLPLLHLLLPIEFIKIPIQSFNPIFPTPFLCLQSPPLPSSYYLLPRYGTYMHLSYPLEKMEMTFMLILIYHLRHPSSRENKIHTHDKRSDQTKIRRPCSLSHSPSSLLGTCMYLGTCNVFLSSSSSSSSTRTLQTRAIHQ